MTKFTTLKKTLWTVIAFFATSVSAHPIDVNTAQSVAANFYKIQIRTEVQPQLALTLTKELNVEQTFNYAYIFNVESGYVIVSGDDRFEPILGYSTESHFDPTNIPFGLRDLLSSYGDEMKAALDQNVTNDSRLTAQWDALIAGTYTPNTRNTRAVTPLLTNNNWNQNNGYNYYCPADANGPAGHAYAGCVALAMGQVMHYWEYPTHGVGSHSYECNHSSSQAGNYPDYGTLSADFEHTTYNYSLMPNYLDGSTPSNQILAVAKLLYHCGIAVEMFYGPEGSMAFHSDIADALQTFFGYDTCQTIYKNNHESDWESILKGDLDLGHPIIYCAYTSAGGHEFICDGYNTENYFHFNWGWGGYQNGYFLISNMNPSSYNFNSDHGIVMNIRPRTDNPNTDGIETIEATSIQVFPNPASDRVEINSNDNPIHTASIFNNMGQLISTVSIENVHGQIDISNLTNGIYWIRVSTEKGTSTQKFIKQN